MKYSLRVNEHEMSYIPGQTVLDAFNHQQIPIDQSCGGNGSCGTCRVILTSPELKDLPRNEIEEDMAQMRNFGAQERLACQMECRPELRIQFENWDGESA